MLRRAGSARGDQWDGQTRAGGGQLFDVIAFSHPVLVDAVQHDLAGAEGLRLIQPVQSPLAGAAARIGIAGVFMDHPVAVLEPAVDADDDALAAQPFGHLRDQFGPLQGGGVDRHLVRPVVEASRGLIHAADAARDAEGDVQQPGDIPDPAIVERAPLGTGGDVVEDQFVGARVAIAGGQFGGVAHVRVADELDALDHPAVLDVQAGDDPPGGHWTALMLANGAVMPPPLWLRAG